MQEIKEKYDVLIRSWSAPVGFFYNIIGRTEIVSKNYSKGDIDDQFSVFGFSLDVNSSIRREFVQKHLQAYCLCL